VLGGPAIVRHGVPRHLDTTVPPADDAATLVAELTFPREPWQKVV
jgi:hypothetical protein